MIPVEDQIPQEPLIPEDEPVPQPPPQESPQMLATALESAATKLAAALESVANVGLELAGAIDRSWQKPPIKKTLPNGTQLDARTFVCVKLLGPDADNAMWRVRVEYRGGCEEWPRSMHADALADQAAVNEMW